METSDRAGNRLLSELVDLKLTSKVESHMEEVLLYIVREKGNRRN